MIGNRSTFREFYPEIIEWTEADVENLLEQVEDIDDDDLINAYKVVFQNITSDIQRIQRKAPVVIWQEPQDKLIELIIKQTLELCVSKIVQVGNVPDIQKRMPDILISLGIQSDEWKTQILQPALNDGIVFTKEEFLSVRTGLRNWEDVFVDIPLKRLSDSQNWKRPFDAVDPSLSYSNFPYPDQYAEDMYSRIARGHGWYGVGEWNVANRQYLNALTTAIAINEINEIGNIGRYLVETYVATGNSQSAINLMNDFIAYTNNSKLESRDTIKLMLEAIIVGFALKYDDQKCREFFGELKTCCYPTPSEVVGEWGKWDFVTSLMDVYKFRKDVTSLMNLSMKMQIINDIRG
jgi:hypothetical protein